MSDERLPDLLARRAERGEPRGADRVWADAAEPSYVTASEPKGRPPVLLAVAGAAACLLLLAGFLVARQSDDDSVVDPLDGPDPMGNCLLEVDRESDRSLDDWAELAEAEPGIEVVETLDLREGGAYLGLWPEEAIVEDAYGVSFESHPMSAAEALADEPSVTELTCIEIPARSRIPDPIPAGTTVLAVFGDPDESWDDLAPDLFETPWKAYENITPDRARAELGELFADEPEILDSLRLEDLRANPILLLVDDDDAGWIIDEFSTRDDVSAVVRIPQDQ